MISTFVAGCAGWSATASAVDDNRLWLPLKYQKYFLQLKAEAEAAEASEKCVEVLQGQLDVDTTTPDIPAFNIVCRDRNGRSYNIAGESMEVPEQFHWQKCKRQLAQETRMMAQMRYISVLPPEPEQMEDQDKVKYTVDFDARDISGTALHYRATCVADDKTASLNIKARKD